MTEFVYRVLEQEFDENGVRVIKKIDLLSVEYPGFPRRNAGEVVEAIVTRNLFEETTEASRQPDGTESGSTSRDRE